jgi:hypothetical protein
MKGVNLSLTTYNSKNSRESKDVEEFKSLLDNFFQSIPDEPKVVEYV